MAITAYKNGQYLGSGLINQKYQPLENITMSSEDRKQLTDIANKRISIYEDAGKDLNLVEYFGENLAGVATTEQAANSLPPLVVISSRRSKFIKAAWKSGRDGLNGENYYDGVNDRTVLTYGGVPIYMPYRQLEAEAPHRRTYIFVHQSEYDTYYKALRNTGMTVIGWRVGTPDNQCVGFGATRYAAIQFFKQINVNLLWLIDDNVVFINSFPEFTEIETNGITSQPGCCGLGFTGCTSLTPNANFPGMAGKRNDPSNLRITPAGILQQMVLWNIQRLTELQVNFSPYFFSSAEDSSFTKYLKQLNDNNCLMYKGSSILKIAVPSKLISTQKTEGVKNLDDYISDMTLLLYKNRQPLQINTQTLDELLASFDDATRNKEIAGYAHSKALEQIMARCYDIPGLALPATFFKFPNAVCNFNEVSNG